MAEKRGFGVSNDEELACKESSAIYSRKPWVAPDGGYGWVIVACCFMCIFTIDGLVGSFGLLLPSLLQHFHSTASVTTMVNSLLIGLFLLMGPTTGFLIAKFGCRTVSFTGAIVASLGLFLSFFAPNIWVLFATYGILGGVGVGMAYLPSMLMINEYFDRRRSLATGIVTSGSGVGMMVVSPVIEISINYYGWRGAFMVYACFTLQLCVCASLMKPLKQKKVQQEFDHIDHTYNLEGDTDDGQVDQYSSMPFLHRTANITVYNSSLSLPVVINEQKCKDTTIDKDIQIFENSKNVTKTGICGRRFLTNKAFAMICIGAIFSQMGQFIPLVFLGEYGKSVGIDSAKISIVISIFGIVNTIGRLFAGFVANFRRLSHLTICNIGLFLSGVSCFLFPFCQTFESLIGFAIGFGFFIGFFPPMQPVMLLDYIGLDDMTAAFGFVTMLKGPAAMSGPPFAGALLDMTGKYEYVVCFAGLIFMMATAVQAVILCLKPKHKH